MEIKIKSCLVGAMAAEGTVVVVDVFRSGNTLAALLAAGAPYVLPVAELDEARRLKEIHPEWLLVGERGGLKPEDFDLNNSPSEAEALDLTGRPAVLTTSAGTLGLTAAAPRADHLLMATLINARAVAGYILDKGSPLVTIVPIGLEARVPAVEDDLAAEYLAALLQGKSPDYRPVVKGMLAGDGADRLRRLGQWRDLAYCLKLDRLNLIPVVENKDGRLVIQASLPGQR